MHDLAEHELHVELFPKGKADSRGASNGHDVLAVLEMARFRRRRAVSFAPIQCGRVQCLGFHHACSSRSKNRGLLEESAPLPEVVRVKY